MNIAIGTQRRPKVNAAKKAITEFAPLLGVGQSRIRFYPLDVESGIPAMPMTIRELMLGARNRAENARAVLAAQGMQADFAIGLEGGFFFEEIPEQGPCYFLQSWVYVLRGDSGYFGSSAAIPVPPAIVQEMQATREELGKVIDHFAGEENVRDKGGAFEVFTLGKIDRARSYELALTCALAPFYNPGIYELAQSEE